MITVLRIAGFDTLPPADFLNIVHPRLSTVKPTTQQSSKIAVSVARQQHTRSNDSVN